VKRIIEAPVGPERAIERVTAGGDDDATDADPGPPEGIGPPVDPGPPAGTGRP
jgi:hypothetical protein